jgi:hypothetical protein
VSVRVSVPVCSVPVETSVVSNAQPRRRGSASAILRADCGRWLLAGIDTASGRFPDRRRLCCGGRDVVVEAKQVVWVVAPLQLA